MEKRSICVLDMNTIGLFNYLTELDEEQQRRKEELDRVVDEILAARRNGFEPITFTVSFEMTKEEMQYVKSKTCGMSIEMCGDLD